MLKIKNKRLESINSDLTDKGKANENSSNKKVDSKDTFEENHKIGKFNREDFRKMIGCGG